MSCPHCVNVLYAHHVFPSLHPSWLIPPIGYSMAPPLSWKIPGREINIRSRGQLKPSSDTPSFYLLTALLMYGYVGSSFVWAQYVAEITEKSQLKLTEIQWFLTQPIFTEIQASQSSCERVRRVIMWCLFMSSRFNLCSTFTFVSLQVILW